MNHATFWMYLLTMAGVTYLVRMLPMVLLKKQIKNRFILSFLHYIPYTVLSVMTVPAIFSATSSTISAWVGFAVAVVAAFFKRSLLTVAALSCVAVFVAETILHVCV
ncbi:MAG: AzlD domain-containing protein [Ruminococcaceae bacterium]|nr:AzlD domain-containing protein [Oscillospiraceae bacterium]